MVDGFRAVPPVHSGKRTTGRRGQCVLVQHLYDQYGSVFELDHFPDESAVFELTSAYGTVGLSLGTPNVLHITHLGSFNWFYFRQITPFRAH